MGPTGLDAPVSDTYTDPPQYCEKRNGCVVCRRPRGHDGRHALELEGVWFYWNESQRWGTCDQVHPHNLIYCGRDLGHEDRHMAASSLGMILGIWG